MKKLICLLVASMVAMAGSQSIFARSLSADEALSLVASKMRHLAAGERSMHLALELKASGTDANTVYVFASQSGFAVVAADDVVDNLLLGYSDDGVFDPANIPPAMQWYLDECSASIERCVKEDAEGIARMARRDAPQRTPIAPLVQTKWNQDAPYNNMCPIVNNGRSVTGCVATAMAQVMRVHQWPEQGVGSHEYSWTVNNVTYTTSADFGSTTYDWANMLNVYDANATADQNDAVATLMYHCGVAADMGYTPSESGASDLTAGVGLIEYFNYDKSAKYQERKWYTLDEWNDLVYNEISSGRPVLYGGSKANGGGHEFVCDGYSQDNYFHINWGWGGYSDGYFLLSQLNPAHEGIGAGSGTGGYTSGQSIIVDLKPNAGTQNPDAGTQSIVPVVGVGDQFRPQYSNYTVGQSITFEGNYFSYSFGDISGNFGVHIIGDGIDKYISGAGVYNIGKPNGLSINGIRSFTISFSSFPIGDYEVYPAFKPTGGDWVPVYYNKEMYPDPVTFNVTSDKITVNIPGAEPEPDPEVSMSARFVSISPVSESDGSSYYPGHTYIVEYDITATGAWWGNLIAGQRNGNTIYGSSPEKRIEFSEAGTKRVSFPLTLTSSYTGGFNIGLYEKNGSSYSLKSDTYNISVISFTRSGNGVLTSMTNSSISGSGSYYDPYVFTMGAQSVTLNIICTEAPWIEEIGMTFYNTSPSGTQISLSSYDRSIKTVRMDNVGETAQLTFPFSTYDLEEDKIYAYSPINTNFEYFKIKKAAVLTDGEVYDNATDIEGIDVDYVRTFNNTEWQPLYVPFNLSYNEWSTDAEVARLSGIHEYDDNNDGTVDRRVVEFITVPSGDITPNTPYVIKVNSTGTFTFHGKGKTLKAAPSIEGSADCSSFTHTYYLKGIYQPKTDIAMHPDIFVMSDGKFGHTSQTLKPNRFYLQRMTKSNSGYLGSTAPDLDEVIYISVNGQICGTIDSLIDANDVDADAPLYDLMGRPVANPQPGLYIRGGKKVYVK